MATTHPSPEHTTLQAYGAVLDLVLERPGIGITEVLKSGKEQGFTFGDLLRAVQFLEQGRLVRSELADTRHTVGDLLYPL